MENLLKYLILFLMSSLLKKKTIPPLYIGKTIKL